MNNLDNWITVCEECINKTIKGWDIKVVKISKKYDKRTNNTK